MFHDFTQKTPFRIDFEVIFVFFWNVSQTDMRSARGGGLGLLFDEALLHIVSVTN